MSLFLYLVEHARFFVLTSLEDGSLYIKAIYKSVTLLCGSYVTIIKMECKNASAFLRGFTFFYFFLGAIYNSQLKIKLILHASRKGVLTQFSHLILKHKKGLDSLNVFSFIG